MNLRTLILTSLLLVAAAVATAPTAAASDLRCIGATQPACDEANDLRRCDGSEGPHVCVHTGTTQGTCVGVTWGMQGLGGCVGLAPPAVVVCTSWYAVLWGHCPTDLLPA